MNKVYKVIWNASLGAWVAVSELAKSKTKTKGEKCLNRTLGEINSSQDDSKFLKLSLLSLCMGMSVQVYATKIISTTGTGAGTASNGSVANDDNLNILYWKNPNLPDSMKLPEGTSQATGGAVAIGDNAKAIARSSVVIGSNSTATINDATTVGSVANNLGASVVIGANNYSNGNNNVAIGNRAYTTGNAALAIGREAAATKDFSLALGTVSSATGTKSTAIGHSSVASGTGAVAIGSSTGETKDWNATGTTAKGTNSVAIGTSANATNTDALALGTSAQATDENAVAVGKSAQATAKNSISIGTANIVSEEDSGAIGQLTNITGVGTYSLGNNNGTIAAHSSGVFGNDNTIAGTISDVRVIGNANTVSENNALVFGNQNTASGTNSTVIGNQSEVTGNDAIAFGTRAKTEGNEAIALGADAEANGFRSVVVGAEAKGIARWTTALGNYAQANEDQGTAVGSSTIANERATAVGAEAQALGKASIAIGGAPSQYVATQAIGESSIVIGTAQATATAKDAIAVGTSAKAKAADAVALGSSAQATKEYSTAVGVNAEASENSAFAGGDTAKATGIASTAVGAYTQAVGQSSFAGGFQSQAVGTNSVAVGTATESGEHAVAIGSLTKGIGVSSVALGASAEAQGERSVVVGTSSVSSGLSSVAVGDSAQSGGNYAIAIGTTAQATGQNSISVGTGASAIAESATALGILATANKENSVALGAYANTDSDATSENSAAVGELTYSGFAGQAADAGMQVSIGSDGAERQLKNVAAGKISADSTDAINGSQLYATNAVLSNVANSTVNLIGGGVTLDETGNVTGPFVVDGKSHVDIATAISAAKTTVKAGTNVASVDKVTDAATGQNTYTVNANGTTASAGSDAVTVKAGTANADNVTDYAIDLSDKTKDSLTAADSALQEIETQIDGVTVKTVNKADNKANFVTGDNMLLEDDGQGGIKISTAKDVNFDNVTVGDTILNGDSITLGDTVINGDSVTTTNLTVTGETKLGDSFTVNNGGATYTGPITNGDHIVNKAYVDGAQTEVVAGTNIANVGHAYDASTGKNTYTVNAKGTTASAGSTALTVTAGSPDANNVTDYAIDLSTDTKNSLAQADTALQTIVTQIDGTNVKTLDKTNNTANFISGKNIELTANGGGIEIATAAEVEFDKVTVGDTVLNGDNITLGDTIINGDSITTTNLTATGETKLGDNFVVNQDGDVFYNTTITDASDNKSIVNKEYVDNSVTELADKPLTFAANSGTPVKKKLGETVTIKGAGAKADDAYSAENIKTIIDTDGNLIVAMDKNLSADSLTLNGQNGADGISLTGAAGAPGVDGKDGITRIIYKDPTTGEEQQVATLNDGLKFGGNTGTAIEKKLNEQLDITGTLANSAEASGANLRVDAKDGKLNLVMSKDLTDLNSVTVGDTIIKGDSITTNNLTVAGETKLGDNFVVNQDGDVFYNTTITDASDNKSIVNKEYVDNSVTELADKPLTFAANSGTPVKKKLGETVTIKGAGAKADDAYSAENIKTIIDTDGNLIVAMDKNLSADSLTLNGQNGADGISLTGAAGKPGVDGKDGITRIIYKDPTTGEEQQVATLNDGLKFGGNTGTAIEKKLNEQLDITGALANSAEASGANLRVDAKDGKLNLVMSKDLTDLNSVTVGDTIIKGDSITTNNLTVAGETKLGDNFVVNNEGATYNGPITAGDHITNKTYVDQQTAAAKTKVEAGKNITVNSITGDDGESIYTVSTSDVVDFTKVVVGDTTITSEGLVIANGPSITKEGMNAGGQKITDVADGEISEDSTDVVNGSQLHALGNNITNVFGGNAEYVNNQITWTNIGGTGEKTIDDAIAYVNNQAANANQGWKVSTDSGTAATSTVKPGDTVNIKGDTASGITVTNSGNDITVGLADHITVGSGDTAVSIDGNAGTIKAGDVIIDGSKGNITAGQVTVNGDAGTVNGLTNTTWDPDNIVSGQAATEDQLQQVAQNAAAAAAAAKTTVTEGENITVTASKNADGSTNYQVATKKDVKFDSVTSKNVSTDKVTVGNVVIDQAGLNAGGNKVTNVADGAISSTSKDAINGSQLYTSNTNIYNYLGGGANYETNTGPTYNVGGGSHKNVGDALDALNKRDDQLDQKITNLGDQLQQAFYTTNARIDDVERRAMAGIAAAMAMETAPYVAGKWTYAAAAAHHGGENAVGVTFRKTADNGRWAMTTGVAAASQGDPSFRIGISGVID